MPAIKRKPVKFHVPVEEVKPAIEKLLAEFGSFDLICEFLEKRGPSSKQSWRKILQKIYNDSYKHGLHPNLAEIIMLEAGLDTPAQEYKQKIYKVTGFYPTGFEELQVRNWFYLSRKNALRRKKKLEDKGMFVEWAVADTKWKELRP